MPQFLVIGANLKTGEDARITITADTASDAELVASGRGIAVSKIIEQATQAGAQAKAQPSRLRQWLRIISGSLALVAFAFGFAAALSNGAPFGTAIGMGIMLAFLPGVWLLALFVNRAV